MTNNPLLQKFNLKDQAAPFDQIKTEHYMPALEEAIKEASRIMIQHLMLITDENITFNDSARKEDTIVDEHILHMRKLLKTSLEDLDLSVRAYNCLKAAKINSLGEMVKYDTHELLKFRNFGKKSLVEIEELLATKGLSFGMDLAKYKLDEE